MARPHPDTQLIVLAHLKLRTRLEQNYKLNISTLLPDVPQIPWLNYKKIILSSHSQSHLARNENASGITP